MKYSAHILYTKLVKKLCCFMLFHFCHHTEELAVLCGLINMDPNIPLCIMNLLQICGSSPHFHGVTAKLVNTYPVTTFLPLI
jgi:hypothetical protein